MIGSLSQDLRHGARVLRQSPAFTLITVLMLGHGIDVNATRRAARLELRWPS